MTFIAVLAALLAERVFGRWRDDMRRLLRWLRRVESPMAILLTVLTPAVLVGLLMLPHYPPLLRTLISGLVLFVCLGPRDLSADIHALIEAREQGNALAICRLTRAMRHGPEPEAGHRSMLGSLFVQSHERVFGVLLWFVIGGPAAALLYRMTSWMVRYGCNDREGSEFADTLHSALAFIPVRITAVLYALAGSADGAWEAWQRLREEPHPDWRRHSWTILSDVGVAALNYDDDGATIMPPSVDQCLAEVLRMQNRALLIVLAAFGLASTGFWLR